MAQQVDRSGRPPLWRDERVIRVVVQIAFFLGVFAVLWYLVSTLLSNMQAQGMRTDWGFLDQAAGFRIAGTDFNPRDSVARALLTAFSNTVKVAVWALVFASVLGLIVGVARLSTNWLVNRAAAMFVEGLRNIPLIIFLFFLYFAVFLQLPQIDNAVNVAGFVLSNRGLYTPWFELDPNSLAFVIALLVAVVAAVAVMAWRTRLFVATGAPHHRVLWGAGVFLLLAVVAWVALGRPLSFTVPHLDGTDVTGGYRMTIEYGALLIGLSVYMAAFIAEIIRGSVLAVHKGQGEAATALGLSPAQRYRHVILPQALRIAVPPTGNEYINLAKNTALGVAIAFPELLRVTRIAVAQATPAPQMFFIMSMLYLGLSISISLLINFANRRLALRGSS